MDYDQDFLTNNLLNRHCNLVTAVRELAIQPDINNYHHLKKMLVTHSPATIGEMLISASRMGVIRDVEVILPTALVHGLDIQMHESFCVAAKNCHLSIMEVLLQYNIDINYNNQLALCNAVSSGHAESVQFLLNNGADVHYDDDKLLLLCCKSGDYDDVICTLIENGIDTLKHYHETYNCCLKQNRQKCGTILIKYSYSALPQTKNSIEYSPQENDLLRDYYDINNSCLVNNNEEGEGDGNGDYYLLDNNGETHHANDENGDYYLQDSDGDAHHVTDENQTIVKSNDNISPNNP